MASAHSAELARALREGHEEAVEVNQVGRAYQSRELQADATASLLLLISVA